jgi:hypothetical protein
MVFATFWDVAQSILVVTDVSEQAIVSIFNDQEVQEFLDCLTLKNKTAKLSRNVCK